MLFPKSRCDQQRRFTSLPVTDVKIQIKQIKEQKYCSEMQNTSLVYHLFIYSDPISAGDYQSLVTASGVLSISIFGSHWKTR